MSPTRSLIAANCRRATRAIVLACLTILVSLAQAEDIKLVNGQILKNATITNQDAIGVTISHSSGIARIPYDMLPDDLRRKFTYDSAKARSQADAEARAAAELAQAEKAFRDQEAREAKEKQISEQLDKAALTIEGKVLSVAREGLLLNHVTIKVPAMKDVVVWRNPLDGSPRYARQPGFNTISSEEPIFVYGASGLVDGDYYSAVVYPAPHYAYTATSGAAKTVRAFAASKKLCLRLFERSEAK